MKKMKYQDNIDFIKDFRDRAAKHQEITNKIESIYRRCVSLKSKRSNIVKYLNNKVMGTGTSSLRKTTIRLSEPEKHSYRANGNYIDKEVCQFLTFNHKGMGQLKDAIDGKGDAFIWGSFVSNELYEEEWLKVIMNDIMRNNIKMEFIKMNASKLLRTFVDLESVVPELKNIIEISNDLEKMNLEGDVDTIKINIPDMQYDRNLELSPMIIQSICISDRNQVILVDNDEETRTLNTGTIECAMAFMQMTPELLKYIDDQEKKIAGAELIVNANENSIHTKLALYSVMGELSNDTA